jgi:hypothetical protein
LQRVVGCAQELIDLDLLAGKFKRIIFCTARISLCSVGASWNVAPPRQVKAPPIMRL